MSKKSVCNEVKLDEIVLDQIFQTYKHEISGAIYNRLGSKEDVEDLTQETFERYSAASKRVPIGDVRAYLYRVAKNLVADHLKHHVRKGKMLISSENPVDIQDPAPTIEQQLIQSTRYDQLKEAIGKLPPKCRTVFILRKLEGLSYAEISEKLNISTAAVEQHVVRGLKACRFELIKNAKVMKK